MKSGLGNGFTTFKRRNAEHLSTDDQSSDKMESKVEEFKENLPPLNFAEANFNIRLVSEEPGRGREDPHLNSSSLKKDTNSRCIDVLPCNSITAEHSQAETYQIFVPLKKACKQVDEDMLKEISEIEYIRASILKIEEKIDDMEWKLKMDESEIEILEYASLAQATKLEKFKPIFNKRKYIKEIETDNKILIASLAEAMRWITDLTIKKEQIKELNDHS